MQNADSQIWLKAFVFKFEFKSKRLEINLESVKHTSLALCNVSLHGSHVDHHLPNSHSVYNWRLTLT